MTIKDLIESGNINEYAVIKTEDEANLIYYGGRFLSFCKFDTKYQFYIMNQAVLQAEIKSIWEAPLEGLFETVDYFTREFMK